MKKYIILDSYDYADEFYYPVISVFTEKNKEYIKENSHYIQGGDYYFGSNEYLEFDKKDILSMIESAKEITEEELKVLQKFRALDTGLDIVDRALDEIYDGIHYPEDRL